MNSDVLSISECCWRSTRPIHVCLLDRKRNYPHTQKKKTQHTLTHTVENPRERENKQHVNINLNISKYTPTYNIIAYCRAGKKVDYLFIERGNIHT